MNKVAAISLLLVGSWSAWAAEEKGYVEARVKAIAPYLDDQTIAVAHADLGRVDPAALSARFTQLAKLEPKQAAEFKAGVTSGLRAFTQAGGKDVYVFVSMADLPQNPPFVIVPLAGNADVAALVKLLKGSQFGSEVCERVGDAVFAGSRPARERLRKLKPAPRPELSQAVEAAGDTAAQILVLPSADARRAIKDSLPELPKELGGGPVTVLTDGILWGALGVDAPPPRMTVRGVIRSKDATAAKQLEAWVAGLWRLAAGQQGVREALPNFDALAKRLTPKAEGDRLTLKADDRELAALLTPAVRQARAAADRAVSMNNLKQIGLALHSFHDSKGHFPTAATFDKAGKPLLSWRVQILPYIEQDALYKEFHLDEPWDSEHNKKLIPRMPKIFQGNPNLPAGKTTYLGVTGKDAMFPAGPKPITIRDVTDGTSNTIFVVEFADDRAAVWTKPVDYKYDPDAPLAGLASRDGGVFLALFADGSVRVISHKIDPKTLRALYTRSGGEVIGEIP